MQKPCKNCPFRTDRHFKGLTPERAEEIDSSIKNDELFLCHQTMNWELKDRTVCIGSVLYLEFGKGVFANWKYRVAELRGDFNIKELDYSFPVAKSLKEFVEVSSIENS